MTDDAKSRLEEAVAAVAGPKTKPNGSPPPNDSPDDGISASLRQKIGIPNPESPGSAALAKQWGNHIAKRYEGQATKTYAIELPSGLMVEARRANIMLLLRFGKIPDAITPVVSWMIEEIEVGGIARLNKSIAKREEDPIDRLKLNQEMLDLFDYLWVYCVVEPRFTDRVIETNETTFYVGDVDIRDKEFFYQWSQGVDVNVREFRRPESTTAVGDVPAVGEDGSATE